IDQVNHSIYDVISNDEKVEDCIYPTAFENLHLLPSSPHLAGAEVELSTTVSRETILKQRLHNIIESYDYIIIDCPPSLSLLTLNAFSFTNQLIIPVQCEYFALEGLAKLLNTVQLIKDRLNPNLEILGIVLTMFDRRTSLNRQVVKNAKDHFQDLIFETIIPRNIRLAEAPSFGLPIALYEPKSSGSIAYYHLTKEVIKRVNTTTPIRQGA
ncbi:MAG: AAA family ATPase, partial [Candidatus Margulisiibacteriota bacterium]